jgi:hypothetical protein
LGTTDIERGDDLKTRRRRRITKIKGNGTIKLKYSKFIRPLAWDK